MCAVGHERPRRPARRSPARASTARCSTAAWARGRSVYDDVELAAGGARVVQVRRRGKGCLSYLVGAGNAAVVIDPAADTGVYLARAAARGWSITHVLDTHLHADHVSGARALAEATGAELILNPADRFAFAHTSLVDGMEVRIADGVAITVSVLSTPGHTSGSTTFLLDDAAAFTGDTLFLRVGRPPRPRRQGRGVRPRPLPLAPRQGPLPARRRDGPPRALRRGGRGARGRPRRRAPRRASRAAVAAARRRGRVRRVGRRLGRRRARPTTRRSSRRTRPGAASTTASAQDLEAGPNRCAIAS